MAKPVWNGTISFGLLNVPVQLYSGERSLDVRFRQLDSRNRSRIRYERINAQTGKQVDWKDIVKAYEYEKDNFVVVDEQEIRAAAPEATETVEIQAFVDRESISPVYFEKPYILVPRKKAEKGYVLLRETLKRTARVGVGKVVIRTRQYLAALMPQDDALLLDLMRFPEELVGFEEFELPASKPEDYHLSARELDMAGQLIDSMTSAWNPADYRDDFRDRLRGIIEQHIASETGGKPPPARAPAGRAAATNVVDFMALLQKSLAAKGEAGGRRAPRANAPARATPAARSNPAAHGAAPARAHAGARAGGAARDGRQRPASARRAGAHRHRAG
ncbi:MAG TPA: Ku protein [Steroidobacteraceae bacterium]|jgi:DNA end-binding protein Ku|nr:Ku protein [Steroidobacteraceae bacterium]